MTETMAFRDRYPGPWRVFEVPGGFEVVASCGTSLVRVHGKSNRYAPGLSWSEALTLAKAIAELGEGHG